MSIAVLYALVTMIGWGVSDFTMKRLGATFGPFRGIAYRNVFAVGTILCVFAFFAPPVTFDLPLWMYAAAIAIAGYFPFMFFTSAMKYGKVGLVVPVSKSWILVAALIGFVFMGEE